MRRNGTRSEDRDVGSEELPVSALRWGDDDSGDIVVAELREGDDGDDPGELIVGSVFECWGLYKRNRVFTHRPLAVQVLDDDSREWIARARARQGETTG